MSYSWSIVAFLVVNLALPSSQTATEDEHCSIFTNGICLPKAYNKHMPPEKSMKVNVSIRLQQIKAIDEERSEIDLMAIISLFWKEHRFTFSNNTDLRSPSKGSSYIPLNIHWMDKMWIPDLYIYQMLAVNTLELFNHGFTGVCEYKKQKPTVFLSN